MRSVYGVIRSDGDRNIEREIGYVDIDISALVILLCRHSGSEFKKMEEVCRKKFMMMT